MIKKEILENGLEVVEIKEKNTNEIGILVSAHTGSVFEPPEYRGISHFLEHMLFMSNEKYSRREISRVIEEQGYILNGFTDSDSTNIYFHGYTGNVGNFKKALDVVYSMLVAKRYRADEFAKEKTIVLSEMAQMMDDPSSCLDISLFRAAFGDSDYGVPIIGTKESVMNITPDVLLEYKNAYYTPDNITVAIVGNVREEYSNIVKEVFSKLCGKRKTRREPKTGKGKDIEIEKNLGMEYIGYAIALPGIPREKKLFATLFATAGASSPSFEIFRERYGLGYHSEYSMSRVYDRTLLSLSFYGVPPKKAETIEKAIRDFYNMVRELLLNDVAKKGRLRYMRTYMGVQYASMEARLMTYASMISEGSEIKPIDDSYIESVLSVTPEIPLPEIGKMNKVVIK